MSRSEELFTRAVIRIPGGVNSPVRAFRAVGGNPVFIREGKGAVVTDEDGKEYIDCLCSWGPLILGHAHPRILEAIAKAAAKGTSFGMPTAAEVEMAETIAGIVPSVEMVRLVNSGTEATMSAVRLARAATGRRTIIKFEGCYHGHGDSFLVKAGSGAATLGVPSSPGVPPALAALTLNATYNDLKSVEQLFDENKNEIAAVIVEPVAGNMGVVLPEPGFLAGLKDLTSRNGALLIFDEVITGFRLGLGGAQGAFGVAPDLSTFGKIIGGGLPVGAYGGSKEIMRLLAPSGPVYQAGTLSGNPLAVAAGLETLKILKEENPYPELEARADRLYAGLKQIASVLRLPAQFNHTASMGTVFFTGDPVRDWPTASKSDTERYAVFFREMLRGGVYLAPAQYEAGFISTAHTDAHIGRILEAAEGAFKAAAG
jgi:glutamate-1-semialdehyde 2,1-aminomutase